MDYRMSTSGSSQALQVVIVYNKSNVFGLARDAELLANQLNLAARKFSKVRVAPVKLLDSREPPSVCDICIHLEIPYAVWFPWAKTNVMLVNSEWWSQEAWGAYLDSFDVAIYRDRASLEKAEALPQRARELLHIPWMSSYRSEAIKGDGDRSKGFVYFVGGSPNKRASAEELCVLWNETYPPLHIYTLEPLNEGLTLASNVHIHVGLLDPKARDTLASTFAGHICCSKAESFGYTAAEAEQLGAYTILNRLPVYEETYGTDSNVGWFDGSAQSLKVCVDQFAGLDLDTCRTERKANSAKRQEAFQQGLGALLSECVESIQNRYRNPLPRHMPPLLNVDDCPPISIITLVRNRPQFIQNACLNLLSSDYPREKMEWVVVDDSDPDQSPSNRVLQFEQLFAPGKVTYIPLPSQRTIGYKRNLGVKKAKHDILLMMDDDDHYPSTSFRRRVAYLLKGRQRYECATCTMIAMYDLQKGVSGVNVPPYALSLGQRCSEATLTFTREFWQARKFADVSMAEGEAFLTGRESQVVEMPPQQIIVAMSHGTNTSRRQMPDAKPGCFWGFDRPFLEFLHGLVGVKIEEEK